MLLPPRRVQSSLFSLPLFSWVCLPLYSSWDAILRKSMYFCSIHQCVHCNKTRIAKPKHILRSKDQLHFLSSIKEFANILFSITFPKGLVLGQKHSLQSKIWHIWLYSLQICQFGKHLLEKKKVEKLEKLKWDVVSHGIVQKITHLRANKSIKNPHLFRVDGFPS